jgi:hypothetical protein
MACCEKCGQTLPEPLPPVGVKINGVKGVILNRVHRAGKHGINSEQLYDHVYGSVKDPPNGLNVLSQHIVQLNRLLAPHRLKIHSTSRGGPGCHAVYSLVNL